MCTSWIANYDVCFCVSGYVYVHVWCMHVVYSYIRVAMYAGAIYV